MSRRLQRQNASRALATVPLQRKIMLLPLIVTHKQLVLSPTTRFTCRIGLLRIPSPDSTTSLLRTL
jgi:hypothetical protein